MRYAQSFETSKQKQERAAKWGIKECKHSPSFDSVTWDKEKVLQALQNWPTNETINWTKLAGDCGIPGRNRGQIAKEFAKENGLDTIKLDSRQPNQRMRAKLFKLPGGGISVPTHQSTEANKQDWAKMIAEGELHEVTQTAGGRRGGVASALPMNPEQQSLDTEWDSQSTWPTSFMLNMHITKRLLPLRCCIPLLTM